MLSAIYFPILRAKAGEMEAIARLHSRTQVRIRPILDVPKYFQNPKKALEEHLGQITKSVADGWGAVLPFYFDLLRYEPDLRTSDGRSAVEYLFSCARQLHLKAIPVAGPESVRGPGPDYLASVCEIAKRDQLGVAVRMPYEDVAEPESLLDKVDQLLSALSLRAEDVDVILDTEALAALPRSLASEQHLYVTLDEAIRELAKREFRNVIISASSVPEHLAKSEDGKPLTVRRVELSVWKRLLESGTPRFPHFSDYAVVFPRETDPDGPVVPPARIRLTTAEYQRFYRAERSDYRDLSKLVMDSSDFSDLPQCWGGDAIRASGTGYGGEGGPTGWVARDTNLHIEVTVIALERYLSIAGRLQELQFASSVPELRTQQLLVT